MSAHTFPPDWDDDTCDYCGRACEAHHPECPAELDQREAAGDHDDQDEPEECFGCGRLTYGDDCPTCDVDFDDDVSANTRGDIAP